MKFSRQNLLLIGFVLISILASPHFAQAQGRGGGGRRGGGERGGFGGGFSGRGGGFRGFGGSSNPLGLVSRPEIGKELGLTDSQIKDLEDLTENQRDQDQSRRESMRDRFSGLRDASPEERQKIMSQIRDERNERSEKSRESINAILSRSQRTRFAQLELQSALRRPGVADALKGLNIKISDDKLEKLRTAERDVREDLQKKIAKLQQQATQDLLKSVFGSREISKMLGEPFNFDTGRRGREGGRARSGRGGERGRATRSRNRTRTRPAPENN